MTMLHQTEAERNDPGFRVLPERSGALGSLVSGRIHELQRSYLAGESGGVAALARLRRAVLHPIGADPDIWELTLAGVPLPVGYRSDEPSRTEIAAHAALTLYALHQQSRPLPMHQGGHGLGRAVRRLQLASGSEAAVRRRFNALGTAATFPEVRHHARGLVLQLRAADIPLDYGLLADQLVWLQSSQGAQRVRLRWGRDFYRVDRLADNTMKQESAVPLSSEGASK